MACDPSLRRRLLRDIAELESRPYPGIRLHVQESLEQACLLLAPEGYKPLHLTVFLHDYPLKAPRITMQSQVRHPNVFGDYICASILHTEEGYTPAYTLKGIAIQLLSFFSSDSLEQDYGGTVKLSRNRASQPGTRGFYCDACDFGDRPIKIRRILDEAEQKEAIKAHRLKLAGVNQCTDESTTKPSQTPPATSPDETIVKPLGIKLTNLPDEILLTIFSSLSAMDLAAVAKAFPRAHSILNSYDLIRLRELQCFCLKESFSRVRLGVGVHIKRWGKEGTLSSEFDLLSHQAFHQHDVRRSIQGLSFEHWLPLPISRRHLRRVTSETTKALLDLATAAKFTDRSPSSVLYHFLNDIVVSFSKEAERSDARSTLSHASEKAVESYFAIYHLLLCVAGEDPAVVSTANSKISRFMSGKSSKTSCPNLGHLLIATLIGDAGLTEDLSVATIKEAVLRNVVWMLDSKGANMPELSYLEPSAISEYRLEKTFKASLTSYRLLMFCHLFCKTARGTSASLETPKPIAQLRDELFDTHGAPPRGLAQSMAEEIRRIKCIDSFPEGDGHPRAQHAREARVYSFPAQHGSEERSGGLFEDADQSDGGSCFTDSERAGCGGSAWDDSRGREVPGWA
ncbi:MAG: hypothetical protein L6R40_008190 [Gallowayella cf. fulva]|nr:MAG: hypothetical protein L6R40_008190 [Xanthomendoza cf. fulva]